MPPTTQPPRNISNSIKTTAFITREQVPPPPKLRRESAYTSRTTHEDDMNDVIMELVRFIENKIMRDENIAKRDADIAVKVLRQVTKIPEDTLPQIRKYTAPFSPIKRIVG